jgi:hypothetical protein
VFPPRRGLCTKIPVKWPPERGCVEDQPQLLDFLGLLRLVEDDTAALLDFFCKAPRRAADRIGVWKMRELYPGAVRTPLPYRVSSKRRTALYFVSTLSTALPQVRVQQSPFTRTPLSQLKSAGVE